MADEQQLMEMCSATGEEERLQGLKGLGRYGIERFLPQLYRALGDESWRVRKEATELFLALPRAGELAGDIIELLHSQDNAGLRNTAVDILVRLGHCAVPRLLEELSCPDHDVRKFILDIFGAVRAEEAMPGMLAALADSDSNVRAAAAENLGRMQLPEAVPALLEAMADADLMLRFTILEALAQIGGEVSVEELLPYHEEKLLRQALFDCLGHVGNGDALPVLIEGLTDSMRNVREAACLAIQRIALRHPEMVQRVMTRQRETGFIDSLGELLASRRVDVRRGAVHLLGWIGHAETAERLLPLLRDEDLSREAAAALISIGSESACSLTGLWPGADAQTRACLAYILGEARCRDCEDLLLAALQDPSADLQQAAAHALGLVGGERSPRALAECLSKCDQQVADTLVQSLSQLAARFPEQVLAAIGHLLEAEAEAVRAQAVSVLGALADDRVDALIGMALKDVAAAVRAAAVRACDGRTGERQRQALLIALTDEESEVRRLAVEVIGAGEGEEVVEALQLAMQDEDMWVRAAAVRSLARQSPEIAVVLLDRALSDKVGLVVIAALETLGELDPDAACSRLLAILEHPDEEVVNAALKQLACSGRSDWVAERGEALLNHGNWEVRLTASRTLAELAPETALRLMEKRLLVEEEDLVRQQFSELIDALRAAQG
ncbi:HEAT repeat domain-containing protein [Geothermobacter hydrogeniphilus]|uniref:HEAT repeat n=1 Tax=Geothermobacter hydrogeniphilus TaxID=1969733 RepID=A0A1X0YE25_9BACT|nr:HEAT repeat domain-containing protein [Geothermobacter hydrogeniphilus]ORJ63343.1 hypothetical protein B5V00_00315 [Geothermobacter hydrogeniphilus]